MTDLKSINHEHGLYVLKCGNGISCLGFDVAETRRQNLSIFAGIDAPKIRRGTAKHYEAYRAASAAAYKHFKATGEKCEADLEPALIGLEGRRVAIIDKDGEEVTRFYVGRSSGWMPCHLEVKRRNSSGGMTAYIPAGATVRLLA